MSGGCFLNPSHSNRRLNMHHHSDEDQTALASLLNAGACELLTLRELPALEGFIAFGDRFEEVECLRAAFLRVQHIDRVRRLKADQVAAF